MWDIDKQLRENEEAAKNSKVIYHPSSIKQRIDALTEAEAKAALKYVLECYADEKAEPFFDATQEARIEFYQKVILDEALKEARK